MNHYVSGLTPYADHLPVRAESLERISMGEGKTPLVPAQHTAPEGVRLYYLPKYLNPTHSFKDDGMVVAVAGALESGAQGILCASTGNTSASAAAYAARAGLPAIFLAPKGVTLEKVNQALAYGARLLSVTGNFDDAQSTARELEGLLRGAYVSVNSTNNHRIEGQKTAAFYITDQLGFVPDVLILPVGNAGSITAYHRGFSEQGKRVPYLFGIQAEGAAPVAKGKVFSHPDTIAGAIRIGNPANWEKANAAIGLTHYDENGAVGTRGRVYTVSDEEIMQAHHDLATCEGMYVEPASAVTLAGLRKYHSLLIREFGKGMTVVAVLTGSGLKSPAAATDSIEKIVVADAEEAMRYIRGKVPQRELIGARR